MCVLGQVALDIVCAARSGCHVHFLWLAPRKISAARLLARWEVLVLILVLGLVVVLVVVLLVIVILLAIVTVIVI